MGEKPELTYREAGVDVAAGEAFVRAIGRAVRSTHAAHAGRVIEGPSDFAGLFRLGEGYRDPVLVSGTDGVGTKLLLAQQLGRHDTVGIDLVAMCVNDILTARAEPLFFLDYLATGRIAPEVLAAVVEGVAEGCRRAGCALLGGETAEMPGVYGPGVYDLAGFAVGVVERERLRAAGGAREGDILLGLPSSGPHSNGYSLVRRIFAGGGDLAAPLPESGVERPLGEALLEPTRIYARAAAVLRESPAVRAMAHITGGGLPGNVGRIVPAGLQARLRPGAWPAPPVFGLIRARGPVAPAEMFRTFNMGLGFVVAVEEGGAREVAAALAGAGEEAFPVGEVVRRPPGAPAVWIEGVSG